MKIPARFLLLIFIVLVSALLRLWQFGLVPPSPDWDEVALGYNAYSIMQTGRDEYGKFLPVILRSFDDYKPALYAYLIIPFVKLFELNIISVRLPSAIFGILTVLGTYFLVKELFEINHKFKITNSKQTPNLNDQNSKHALENGSWKMEDGVALLSAALLAISPWHIQFSRIAFESNVGLALNVFSVFFFIKGIKKPLYLLLYTLCAGLSLYMYQSEKVFVPLLFILLVFIYRNSLFNLPKKYLVLSLIVGLIISFPIAHYTLTKKEALTRAQGVSVFSEDNQYLNDLSKRNLINRERGDLIGLIFDNRRIWYAKSIIANYLSHYNIYWLFLSGDENRHHAPSMGLLYLWEFPFLFIGIYSLLSGKWNTKLKLLTFGLFLLAPVPAAFTTGVPHSVRTLNFLPTFQVFTAIGIISASQKIFNFQFSIFNFKYFKLFIAVFIFSFFIFNFVYYLNQYFVQQNYFYSEVWQYGYKDAIAEVKKIEHKYNKIIVSNQPHLDQSYIFFLFYLKYPPSLYQKELVNPSGGFREEHKFGKFEFRPIIWDKEVKSSNILYIGRPSDFFEPSKILKVINFLNKKSAILIVEG